MLARGEPAPGVHTTQRASRPSQRDTPPTRPAAPASPRQQHQSPHEDVRTATPVHTPSQHRRPSSTTPARPHRALHPAAHALIPGIRCGPRACQQCRHQRAGSTQQPSAGITDISQP